MKHKIENIALLGIIKVVAVPRKNEVHTYLNTNTISKVAFYFTFYLNWQKVPSADMSPLLKKNSFEDRERVLFFPELKHLLVIWKKKH